LFNDWLKPFIINVHQGYAKSGGDGDISKLLSKLFGYQSNFAWATTK